MRVNIDENSFENIFIYISDALRYDSVSSTVAKYGSIIKTASSGLATPESVSSIVSGVYPPRHGVWQFSSCLPDDLTTVFDISSEKSLVVGYNGKVLKNMLGYPDIPSTPIEDISPPFSLVVKDDFAHSPYAIDLEGPNPKFESHPAYWREHASSNHKVKQDYRRGTQKTADRFETMLDRLRDRDLLDDTLVIYTSDHGELLGKDGLVDHGAPIRPELVYVPTVFCNDSVSIQGEFMAHVDISPTILSALSEPIPDTLPGYDLLEGAPSNRLALNNIERPFYSGTSVWDKDGGITFTEDSVVDRARFALQNLRGRGTSPFTRRHPISAMAEFMKRNRTFGDPSFTRSEADEFRQTLSERTRTVDQTLDDETVSRLEDLGYVEGNEL